MLFALGAASSAMEALQSLLPSKSSTPSTASPFALSGSSAASGSSGAASGASGNSQLSPATMSTLIAAQGQSATGSISQTSTSPAGTLQNLLSQIDGDDDGEATTSPTYGDGSATSPQAMLSAATSSYNFMGQMAQRQPLSFSA
jgi:hypothetical protein